MDNLDNIQRVVGWQTKKQADGSYVGQAYSADYQRDTVIHFEAVRPSRAMAKRAAQNACRELRRLQGKL